MLKEFKCVKEEREGMVEEALHMQRELYFFLDAFAKGEIPSSSYSLYELKRFVQSVVKSQRKADRFFRVDGYWSLLPEGIHMPSDARVDFVYIPTYIAVSILTLFLERFPEEAMTVENYTDALHSGIYFASTRGLRGAGYEAEEGVIEALKILSKGRVLSYLSENVGNDERLRPLYEIISQQLTHYEELVKENKSLDYGFSKITPERIKELLKQIRRG
ncbi:MAG: hypothetical protein Q9M89_09610 [Persephonella sp.]|nr:hypothetical protein [Persephonella sp.]